MPRALSVRTLSTGVRQGDRVATARPTTRPPNRGGAAPSSWVNNIRTKRGCVYHSSFLLAGLWDTTEMQKPPQITAAPAGGLLLAISGG